MSKTDEQLRAEGVTIAEMTAFAGGAGAALGHLIEQAMNNAAAELNAKGIFDDTPPDRVEELLGPDFGGLSGTEAIRSAKQAARVNTKRSFQAEQDRLRAEAQAAADQPEEG